MHLHTYLEEVEVHLGRAYAGELETLSDTYDWAVGVPIGNISEFVKRSAGIPLYVVGSGGSLSVAKFASILHRQTGTISKCLTPMEFLEINAIDGSYAILIVTAGGNNEDILAAFDRAVILGPELLGVLCTSTNNKLIRRTLTHPKTIVYSVKLPTGKDGFLATNSLLAMEVWLARAYAKGFSFIDPLPNSFQPLLYDGIHEKEFETSMLGKLQRLEDRDTIIILHDGWGGVAAVDAESKLVEAGLVSVQMADYRNFAHGRHNWLDKNPQRTGVMALITPRCAKLAAKTIGLIPEHVPVIELSTGFNGPAASLNLLVKVMYVVKFFGIIRRIDPGRPKVAQFGRKIYHLKMPRSDPDLSDREQTILSRKFPNFTMRDNQIVQKTALLRKFVRRLERTKFGGLILDYDGTICDLKSRSRGPPPEMGTYLTRMIQSGILVGVATGRGASVREGLRRIIPKTHWHQLLIGYYNGGDFGSLDDDSKPDTTSPTDSSLKAFLRAVKKRGIILQECQVDARPQQITIHSPTMSAKEIISEMNLDSTDGKVQIVESSHSIDIVKYGVTKTNLLNRMQVEINRNDLQILCIGDRGMWPGNDFELLKTAYSLSVDEVSKDTDSCWNTLPINMVGERGTLEYLKGINTYDNYFMLHLGVKE